ncbi:hypothetical protein F5984_23505 [Rudanella paleaurantiibacter]|uniref:Carboxypeptidase-like regulatory domain-containing protein n=1 Tax=Rudanella paleaurantiibacter TaxID=2614655 RepID=A0A7J5TTH6_9BACT|nr:carboxypeptidase-like regulatory domain-containing protein [Rudanella paleaurantiibacter]KAB7726879.1 hypothetical protein F5984_23505 [Rudanella paleaurantiibacter]
MNYVFLLVFSWVSLGSCLAQYTLKGVVLDSANSRPLEYASVVNLSLNKIAFTDEEGQFQLVVNSKSDRIQITNMGYNPRTVMGLTEGQSVRVLLTEAPILIEEVSVRKRNVQKRSVELGFHNEETYSTNPGPGGEISTTYAVFIKNAQSIDGLIDRAYFKLGKYVIGRNGFSKARVRIFSVNRNTGLPETDLLRENTIVRINPFSQSFSIDLEKLRIPFPNEGVFVGLEFFCYTERKPTGKGRYAIKTNCPHIAVTKMKNYKEVGGCFYHVYDFAKRTWQWVDISAGDYSKAFVNQVWKFGIKVSYYD